MALVTKRHSMRFFKLHTALMQSARSSRKVTVRRFWMGVSMFGKYSKLVATIVAVLVVAVPSLIAASQDGTISLQEWLTVIGLLVVPPTTVALSPANKLTTQQLQEQALDDPKLTVTRLP
jgi:hypothetical protein